MSARVFVGQKCCRGVAGQKTVTKQGFKNISMLFRVFWARISV